MNLETSKNLGGIGALLMFIGIIPYINYFGIIEVIGAILVLIALHGLSDYYTEPRIFSNALFGVVAGVVGVGVAIAVALTVVLGSINNLLYQIYPGWDGNWASLQGMTPDPNAFSSGNFDLSTFIPLIIGVIAVLAIIWIFAIIASFFIRRSLKDVTAKSTVGTFGTAGTLFLIGAFLIIIFGIGLVLMWIGALILAIAFFTLKPQPTQQPMTATTYPPPPPTPV